MRRHGVVARERGHHVGELLLVVQDGEHLVLDLVHAQRIGAALVLDVDGYAVRHAEAGDRGRHEHLPVRLRDVGELLLDALPHRRGRLVGEPALAPVLEVDDDHRLVFAAPAHHRKARDREDALDFVHREERLDGAERHVAGAVAGGAFRHVHGNEDDALVFVRQERRLRGAERLEDEKDNEDEKREREKYPPREPLRELHEKALERVERPVEPRERAVPVGTGLVEEQRAEGRRER